MPAGLEIYDGAGNLILSLTDRITRKVGEVQVNSTGSIAVPEFAQGAAWWIVSIVNIAGQQGALAPPVVYQSGNALVWDYKSYPRRQTVFITYGVY